MKNKIKIAIIFLVLGVFLVKVPSVKAQLCCTQQCPLGGCCGEIYECGQIPDPPDPDPWTCFPAGTKVSMETRLGQGEVKNIEDVKVGDRVLSQAEDGTRSVSTVTKLDQPVRDHMCKLDFSDGDSLKLTNEHPMLTENGWKSITPSATAEENPGLIVEPLSAGDKVVREDGGKLCNYAG